MVAAHELAGSVTDESAADKATSQATDQATSQAMSQAADQATSQITSQAADQTTSQAADQATSHVTFQDADQTTSQAADQATSHVTSQDADQTTSQAVDQATSQASSQDADQTTSQAADQDASQVDSAESVRMLVQEDGRSARNLLVFNVLVDKSPSSVLRSPCRQPAAAGRPDRGVRPDGRPPPRQSVTHVRKRGRARSVSAGRGSAKDLHARYWSFLFENLRRAVDEIYQTCETDDSVLECKETIMILERCTQDFHNLIEWLKIKWEYDHTPKPQRPTSVAWEIRKTSPGKLPLVLGEKKLMSEQSRKQLSLAEQRSTADAATSTEVPAADTDRLCRSATEPAVAQLAAEPDGGQRTARLRPAAAAALAAGRQRVGRLAAPLGAKVQVVVPPRGGMGRAASGRAAPPAASRAVRPELRPVGRQGQPAASRGGVGWRLERPAPVARRPAAEQKRRPAQRAAPPVRPAGSACQPSRPAPTMVRPGLQRSATVCTDRPPSPAQAQVYSSCVKSHSNSSLSSTASSSGHSWADRVRGITSPAAPAAPAVPAAPVAAVAAVALAAAPGAVTPVVTANATDDDGGGWETVKGRSRSRLSSLSQTPHRAPLQRKGSAEAACVGRTFSARARFQQPTAAVSLPSLCRTASGDQTDERRRTSAVGRVSESLQRSCERVPAEPAPLTVAPSHGKTAAPIHNKTAAPSHDKAAAPGRGKAPAPGRGSTPSGRGCRAEGRDQSPPNQISGAPGQTRPTTDQTSTLSDGSKAARVEDQPACWDQMAPAVLDSPVPGSGDPALAAARSDSRATADHQQVQRPAAGDSYISGKPLLEKPGSSPRIVSPSAGASLPLLSSAVSPASRRVVSPAFCRAVSPASRRTASPTVGPTVGRRLDWSEPPAAESAEVTMSAASAGRTVRGPVAPLPCRQLTSPPTPRDLTSPELDEDSVDEEMVMTEEALQSAIVEERNLEQQLAETEKCDIEVDTETDGDSTSVDTECEGDGADGTRRLLPISRNLIEDQYGPELECLSWSDRMDMLEELEELSARAPGRGLQMHEKLSSPSRKKTLSETIRRHHERQQKASLQRQTLMEQKTQKLSEISIKITEVRLQKEQLMEHRRRVLERKMARAEAKRRQHLQDIVRRAHDEEEKAKEIAFINQMEANNKRHDFLSQIQTQELRLVGIQEERQRRVEEKAAKEAAAEEKRRALQEERLAKLEDLKQRRQERLERIHREQQDKEKERLDMAREKQRDREERISALHAAQQATTEELQKRIQQKQEESARRHEENIVHIRQRALELSVRSAAAGGDDTAGQLMPYDTKKMCTLCSLLIGSEVYLLSHLRGRQHGESVRAAVGSDLAGEELLLYNMRHITDAAPQHILNWTYDKDRRKTLKKRCRKIKARMAAKQEEFSLTSQARPEVVDSPHRAKLIKCVKELNKVVASQGRGPWPNSAVSALDRTVGEITRILDKGISADQSTLCGSGGLAVLSQIIALIEDELSRDVEIVPSRTVGNVSRALAAACHAHPDNCAFMVSSNMVSTALDLLITRLTRLSTTCAATGGVRCDPGAAALMQLTSAILTSLTRASLSHQRWSLLQDVCSYIVCVGTVDKMASFFSCVQGSLDSDPHLGHFIVQSLRLLQAMAALLASRYPVSTQRKDAVDRTGLIATLQVTQLVGVVSMLYSVLLRQHQPAQRGTTPPTAIDQSALQLATDGLAALLQTARLDLHMFQTCLGFEGRSVEFRHVTSYLLWYCSHHDQPELLQLVIRTAGYFAVRCYDNQMVLQKGNMPTVLQQLLTLPFSHFSDPQLTVVLFPTLLACSYDNAETRAILQQELSFQILEDFLKHEASKSCHLVRVLLTTDEDGGSARSDVASVASS